MLTPILLTGEKWKRLVARSSVVDISKKHVYMIFEALSDKNDQKNISQTNLCESVHFSHHSRRRLVPFHQAPPQNLVLEPATFLHGYEGNKEPATKPHVK